MTPEQREYHRSWKAAWRANNPELARAQDRERYKRHRAKRNAAMRANYEANADARRAYAVAWRIANPELAKASVRSFHENNPHYSRDRYRTVEHVRIADVLRSGLRSALKRHKTGKDWRSDAKTGAIVGCSKPDLIAHIEAQFLPGMSWSNYGRKGWEMDHIKPCASFDLTQHDQVLLCFHYTNLRPLWRLDNQRRPRKVLP
jgi:hypothetical protein